MDNTPAPSVAPRSGTRLDSYVDRYAARTAGMTASEIRALFAVASRPEVVSLAGGMPNISGLPLDVVGSAIGDLIADQRPGRPAVRLRPGRPRAARADLRGDAARGHRGAPRRRRGHGRLPAGGRPGHPDLLRPRRRRAVRGPVVRRRAGRLQVLPVRRRARRDGRRRAGPRGAGAGDHRGPGGRAGPSSSSTRSRTSTTPPASRWRRSAARRSSRSADAHDILVLEDNPYGLLGFEGEPHAGAARRRGRGRDLPRAPSPRPSRPGMRVGWALAPHAVREKLVLAQESATLCPPSFSQMAVSAYLDHARLAGPDQADARDVPRAPRRDDGRAATTTCPPPARGTSPDGGFFVWVTLPPGIDAKAMLPRAVTARVAYVPGTAFFADGFGVRLDAALVLLPHPRADPRGRAPAGGRARRRRWSCARPSAPVPRPAAWRPQRVRRAEHRPQLTAPDDDERRRRGLERRGTRHDRHGGPARCWSWPAGSPTSATSRCARDAGWPRRCAAPASRSSSATSTPRCWPLLRAERPACVVPMLHGETGEDGAIREVLELLGGPVRRGAAGRVPHGVRQAGRQGGRGPGRDRHPGVGAACRTRRSASWAPPR